MLDSMVQPIPMQPWSHVIARIPTGMSNDQGRPWGKLGSCSLSVSLDCYLEMDQNARPYKTTFLYFFANLWDFAPIFLDTFFFDPSQAVFDLEVDAWLLPHVRLPWLSWHVCC